MPPRANTATTAATSAVVEQDEQQVQSQDSASKPVGYQAVIKRLIADGAKRMNGLRIKNVNFSELENYTRIALTLATPIHGFVTKDNGETWEEGQTNVIFTSLYAITGALKEDEELGWMANTLLEKPEALNLILNGSTVDLIQQSVEAGEEYRNPFSTREDGEPTMYDHKVIINNIIGVKLGKSGQAMANRLADKLMGL